MDSDDPRLADWADLLVLSNDCANGLTVAVSPSPYIRTVGVAYNRKHVGLTALLLGRVQDQKADRVTVTVVAYRGTVPAGRATLTF